MRALPNDENRTTLARDPGRFPPGFLWGAATSAYQVEGAAREDARGESIWDRFSHTPGHVRNGDTGDVAADHYHRYRDDVALIAELGLGAYRFSVAWPRVLPEGRGAVNEAGLDFYDRLVDALAERGIAPFVTLYHWDLPQALEDAGGWPVRETAEAFAAFAHVVASRLGDRAAAFVTINEPWCVANLGYRTGVHAPGRTEPEAAAAAAHHVLVAHGLGVEAIRGAAPGVPVGITLNFEPKHPATAHPLDVEAALVEHDHFNRWFLDPIVGRPYPEDGARAWGWHREQVRPGDADLIARPIDLLGVNYYTRRIVRSPLLPPLADRRSLDRTSLDWEVYPEGLGEVLDLVRSRTGDLPLYVTENGAAFEDHADPTDDPERVRYLRSHLGAALSALGRGVPLRGYFVWSLLDNFEWAEGYAARFGIVHVDYGTQERRIRRSARLWSSVAATGRPQPQDDAPS
jgi:beta-glucosidase